MKRKRHSKMTHVLSIAVLSLGMLFTGPALAHPPAVALAAASSSQQARTISVDTQNEKQAVPESNPYEDSSQCTYRAWELATRAGHKLPGFGDAAEWRQGAIDSGYTVSDTLNEKCVNSVAVWSSGAGGASWAGHVGWVTAVDGNRFRVQDRNWIPAADDERWVTWEDGISFITFDNGAAPQAQPASAPAATDATAQSQPAPATPKPAPQPQPVASILQPTLRAPRLEDLAGRGIKGSSLTPWLGTGAGAPQPNQSPVPGQPDAIPGASAPASNPLATEDVILALLPAGLTAGSTGALG